MIFAKRVFTIAGIYGLIVLTPLYFIEERLSREQPPEITHPEFYYGFVGVALAWQIVFLVIGRDPARYRPMMIPSILEKAGYGAAVMVLFALGRTAAAALPWSILDLGLGVLFAIAYVKTRPSAAAAKNDVAEREM